MNLNAARTYHARKARTRLNLATGHLEGAIAELKQTGLRDQDGRDLSTKASGALLDLYAVLRDVPMANTTMTGRRP